MLTIDGLALPSPAQLTVSYESVGRTEVTADGSLAADRIALKRRVRAGWRGLGREEAALVLTALTRGALLAVTLPDPRTGQSEALTMLVVELDADLMSVDGEGAPAGCRDITTVLRER